MQRDSAEQFSQGEASDDRLFQQHIGIKRSLVIIVTALVIISLGMAGLSFAFEILPENTHPFFFSSWLNLCIYTLGIVAVLAPVAFLWIPVIYSHLPASLSKRLPWFAHKQKDQASALPRSNNNQLDPNGTSNTYTNSSPSIQNFLVDNNLPFYPVTASTSQDNRSPWRNTSTSLVDSSELNQSILEIGRSGRERLNITQQQAPVASHIAISPQCFIMPKEGETLEQCQDRYASNVEFCRFAVADGVATSFVPGYWAQIIARSFVSLQGFFSEEEPFKKWLFDCSDEWRQYIYGVWIPQVDARRQREGYSQQNWDNYVADGAQTTLIGCSFSPKREPEQKSLKIDVFGVGDAAFFLFRSSDNDEILLAEAFPYSHPKQFKPGPNTLATNPKLIKHAWEWKIQKTFTALFGDYIVLASDTMAKWLLAQQNNAHNLWKEMLTNTEQAYFEKIVREERIRGRMEDDDLTLLVIPIQ